MGPPWKSRRGARLVLALVALAYASAPGVATSASSGTVVGATVPSATELSTTLCPSLTTGITDFGSVTPGSSVITGTDCEVRFGSSNDTSMLRIFQTDGGGDAMVAGPTTAALGYWPLNGDLRDVSGTTNHGNALPLAPNTPTFPAGGVGRGSALASDGNDYATIPHHASYDVTSFTVDVWFRATSTDDVIAARQTSACGAAALCQWELWIDNGGRLDANVEVGGVEHIAEGASVVTDGAWHHAAMTVDGATFEVRSYLDGQPHAVDTTWNSGVVDTGVQAITIGRTANNASMLTGAVDELRFQAGVRTPGQVGQYHAARVQDYGGAGALWGGAMTGGMFGACLSSALDGALLDATTWTANAGCAIADAAHWKPIVANGGTPGAKVATSPSNDQDSKVRLRFGFRAGSLPPGSYTVPLTFETVAPNA